MFTGIIEKLGRVSEVSSSGSGEGERSRIVVGTGYPDLVPGESVAVNGVCLTVVESGFGDGQALFFLSPETLSRSNLSGLRAGSRVNLERALELNRAAGGRLSGHWVQGHVDGLGVLARVEAAHDCHWLEIDLADGLDRYCVEKGSIALNGVSLTINRAQKFEGGGRISVALIPHTWANTCFSECAVGDPLNVEVDILAKYVEKLCLPYQKH